MQGARGVRGGKQQCCGAERAAYMWMSPTGGLALGRGPRITASASKKLAPPQFTGLSCCPPATFPVRFYFFTFSPHLSLAASRPPPPPQNTHFYYNQQANMLMRT